MLLSGKCKYDKESKPIAGNPASNLVRSTGAVELAMFSTRRITRTR